MDKKNKLDRTKLTLYIVTGFLALLIISLSVISFIVAGKNAGEKGKQAQNASGTNTTTTQEIIFSVLDGRSIEKEKNSLQPLAVVIENHGKARPQSGLNQAELVFEAVTEGGITRFLAIYQRSNTPKVGPIRSAREYFVDLAKSYGAIFVHAGGSPTGFEAIRSLNVPAINALQYENEFSRSPDRRAPHNLYLDVNNTRELGRALEFKKEKTPQGFKFKSDVAPSERPKSAKIILDFSLPNYVVAYEYEPLSNTYLRSNGGREAIDKEDGKQISPKNVIVILADISPLDDAGRQRINLESSGVAYIFNDGDISFASWFHASPFDEIKLFEANGDEVKLNPGQTWIEIISPDRKLEFFRNGQPVSLIPQT